MTTARPDIEELRAQIEDLQDQVQSLEFDLEDLEARADEIPTSPAVARCIVEDCKEAAADVMPFEYRSPGRNVDLRLMLPLCARHWTDRP